MFVEYRIGDDLTLIPSEFRYLIQVRTSPSGEWRTHRSNLTLQAAEAIRDNDWTTVKGV